MRLQVLSDLHLEFHGERSARFCEELAVAPDLDALVLAGDICPARASEVLSLAFQILSRRVPTILFVPGNHEFYGSSVTDALGTLREIVARFESVVMLEPGTVLRLAGRRILGGTLWFPEPGGDPQDTRFLSDFHVIEGFVPWVYEENARQRAWLTREVREGDIVITHHLPSRQSIHPRWATSRLSRFFLTDMSELLATRSPSLWIHGHTHDTFDYRTGSTRVVCNPFGYAGEAENPDFVEQLVVELP